MALRAARAGIAAFALALALLPCAQAQAGPTIVSLEFDDGVADQWTAHELLRARGMHATFYVNSARPGKARYLSLAQLHAIQQAGGEIGGHTIDHVELPAVGPDEQRRQVCDDRASLLAQGFAVTDFAYPFGAHDPAVEQVVSGCGYQSARTTSGVRSPRGCNGCPAAETIPPADPFATRTPDSVHTDTPLSDLTGYVDQAVAAGGGWVQVVMHHVCDGCNRDSIAPATLAAFLDHLASRAADGVEVRTVHEVIGGPLQPVVHGPALPQPLAPTNLLRNPSLETDTHGAGEPDCFKQGGAGVSSGTWLRTNDAHSGTAAQTVQVSGLGPKADRKLVSRQDTGTCAPVPVGLHRYRVIWWYRSTAPVRPVAYLRAADGGWRFWAQGDPARPSSGWRQAVWTTPRVPAGTVGISVGVSLRAVGSMTLDDLLLQDARTPLPPPAYASGEAADGDATRTTLKVPAGRLPVLVYPSPPADVLAAQAALQRHLETLRRAGFHPIGARAFARVLGGRRAGVRKPVLLAFRGSAVDSIGIADWLLHRDNARATLLAPSPGVLKGATLQALAVASRWDVVAPGSRAGRAIRGRLRMRPRAVRIPMTFSTPRSGLVRALRAAAKRA